MNLADFDYHLPRQFIAQTPLKKRDDSKLMVLDKKNGQVVHHQFFELADLLDSNSILVLNESRVLPARLTFKMGEGNAEILLIKPLTDNTWECMVRPGKKFEPKTHHQINSELSFKVKAITKEGLRVIEFESKDLRTALHTHGQAPTPPYIKEVLDDAERYQTVYSKTEGSAAAPTAGLHFTPQLLEKLKDKGVQIEKVTLHVGLGTFAPVKTQDIEAHKLHSEWFQLTPETAQRLNAAKADGKKIIAVGTTSVRVLETAANSSGILTPQSGETDIFIYPGYNFKFIDQLITNFHVPKSSLLMLVSALAGRKNILNAYQIAQEHHYRFFSFGDAMWIR